MCTFAGRRYATFQGKVVPSKGFIKGFVNDARMNHEECRPKPQHTGLTKREKRGCRRCEEQGVETAAVPARILRKSLVSDRLVIDTMVNKYCDHLPLFRHSAILERETGLEISRVTLCGWVMAVTLGPAACKSGSTLLHFIGRVAKPFSREDNAFRRFCRSASSFGARNFATRKSFV